MRPALTAASAPRRRAPQHTVSQWGSHIVAVHMRACAEFSLNLSLYVCVFGELQEVFSADLCDQMKAQCEVYQRSFVDRQREQLQQQVEILTSQLSTQFSIANE